MKRWWLIALYALAAAFEAALLIGARLVETLSRQKMMLMRYLFAKNIELENGLFSPTGKTVQFWVLVLLGAAFIAGAVALWRRSRFAAVQFAVGALAAASAAWGLHAVSTSQDVAIYAIVLALWLVVMIQAVVVTIGSAMKRGVR